MSDIKIGKASRGGQVAREGGREQAVGEPAHVTFVEGTI